MGVELPAKLFRHAEGQAVAIPHGLELPGEDVVVRQQGDGLVIEPAKVRPRRLAELLATLKPVKDDFGSIEDLPAEPVEF